MSYVLPNRHCNPLENLLFLIRGTTGIWGRRMLGGKFPAIRTTCIPGHCPLDVTQCSL